MSKVVLPPRRTDKADRHQCQCSPMIDSNAAIFRGGKCKLVGQCGIDSPVRKARMTHEPCNIYRKRFGQKGQKGQRRQGFKTAPVRNFDLILCAWQRKTRTTTKIKRSHFSYLIRKIAAHFDFILKNSFRFFACSPELKL